MSGDVQSVAASVSDEAMLVCLQGQRDFRFQVSPEGWIATRCKRCLEVLDLKAVDELLWLRCPVCQRLSFVPLVNLTRDRALAARRGEDLRYEMFYFNALPAGLNSPFEPGF